MTRAFTTSLFSLFLIGFAVAEEAKEISEFKVKNPNWVELTLREEFSETASYFIASSKDAYSLLVYRTNRDNQHPLLWSVQYKENRKYAYSVSKNLFTGLRALVKEPPKNSGGLGGTFIWIDDGGSDDEARAVFWLEGVEGEQRKEVDRMLKYLTKLTGVSVVPNFRIYHNAEQDAAPQIRPR